MKTVYNHYNHAIRLATVHLVWIPCRRKRVFTNNEKLKLRCIEILQSVANDKKWVIKALEIAPDHIHLLVEYDPHHSISQVVKAFKGRSTRNHNPTSKTTTPLNSTSSLRASAPLRETLTPVSSQSKPAVE
nr:IS200/IS605 family transposase [Nodularia sp. LEGE 06071]